ncbi:MAG: GNAT family N-acetyltransferase [Clostridia bacterium]|nr:GNAT family N-acetyltransferase [Clostridia bacterium]
MDISEYKKFTSCLPTMQTERLVLEKLASRHAEDMFEYSSREDVTEFLSWYPHRDIYDTREWIRKTRALYRKGVFCDWAIVLKQSGKMIGTVGFVRFSPENNRAEIGYAMNPDYEGHGFMTEAVSAIINLGFSKFGLNRIEALFIDGDLKSRAVMERCGMTYEGMLADYLTIKGKSRNIGICSITINNYFIRGENHDKKII